MGSSTKPRKKKAPTISADAWEPYKARIIELYLDQKTPLWQVKNTIEEEFGFTAELRQYRTRITQWGKDRNIKPQEMKAIVRKRQRRKLVENSKGMLEFRVRGNSVDSYKIDRWMKKNGVSEDFLYSPSLRASTPSAVSCSTASERGSPPPRLTHSFGSPTFSMSGAFSDQCPRPASLPMSISGILRPSVSDIKREDPAPTDCDSSHLVSDENRRLLNREASNLLAAPGSRTSSQTQEADDEAANGKIDVGNIQQDHSANQSKQDAELSTLLQVCRQDLKEKNSTIEQLRAIVRDQTELRATVERLENAFTHMSQNYVEAKEKIKRLEEIQALQDNFLKSRRENSDLREPSQSHQQLLRADFWKPTSEGSGFRRMPMRANPTIANPVFAENIGSQVPNKLDVKSKIIRLRPPPKYPL